MSLWGRDCSHIFTDVLSLPRPGHSLGVTGLQRPPRPHPHPTPGLNTRSVTHISRPLIGHLATHRPLIGWWSPPPPSETRHLLMVGPRWFISPPQGCSQASNWSSLTKPGLWLADPRFWEAWHSRLSRILPPPHPLITATPPTQMRLLLVHPPDPALSLAYQLDPGLSLADTASCIMYQVALRSGANPSVWRSENNCNK